MPDLTREPPSLAPRSFQPLITSATLDRASLRKLFRGECLALRIPAFCEPQLCEQIGSRLLSSGRIERYDHEVRVSTAATKYEYYGVDRIGFPFNKTLGSEGPQNMVRYQEEALPSIRRVRTACAPHLSPIDKLRLELDEVWPQGCNLASFIGDKMFVGIVRVMNPETSAASEEVPHYDGIPPTTCSFDLQFGANIYLGVPPRGGERVVWNVLGQEHDGSRELPAPAVVVKPMRGDLIIFHAQRMHAIRKFDQERRISFHSFIGFKHGEALQLWN